MPSSSRSFSKRLSSKIFGETKLKLDPQAEYTYLADETIGPAVTKAIQSHLDTLSDDSILKISRQVEFWYTQNSSLDELIVLTERLITAAQRLFDTDTSKGDEPPSPSPVSFQVPKVRFGRTELQMPIVTCGGMRLQHTWMPDNFPVSASSKTVLNSSSQPNVRNIVKACLRVGLNHFETARLYGTSEMQLVDALGGMMASGEIQREDFIFQTKVMPGKNRAEFEKTFQATWSHVSKLGYIDLFAFHLVSKESDVEAVLQETDGIYGFIKEQQSQGHIKHIGFSTHGTAECILECVSSNKFDYVNIHHHYFGDYHAAGTPEPSGQGQGNAAAFAKAQELDMGLFLISPLDKGGKLYRPSSVLARATGSTMTPIAFAALHAWKTKGFHTLSVGLARPSDLEEILEAAALYDDPSSVGLLTAAETNLHRIAVEKLGEEWMEQGLLNIPSCYRKPTQGVAVGHILWLHNLVAAYGMIEVARDRYQNLESAKWNPKKSFEENIAVMGSTNPGRALHDSGIDLDIVLKDHYNPALAKEKLAQAHEWLSKSTKMPSTHDTATSAKEELKDLGWDRAYNLTLWDEFPGDANDLSLGKILIQNITRGSFGINNAQGRRNSYLDAERLRQSFSSVQ